MLLNYFALFVLILVFLILFYGVIIIHDIPYHIAQKRQPPHQDAIHVAGWISLFTLHAIWPFLWIWATLYRPDRGWGMASQTEDSLQRKELEHRIALLEAALKNSQQASAGNKDK
ncbi:DUF3302 domain-containing protein [Klebsiella sp. K796]|uniref:DUF3302 domain-containing protein n=1 Tax=Klebsiella sp. K796 TaxID=3369403 RepID=UPI003C2B6748